MYSDIRTNWLVFYAMNDVVDVGFLFSVGYYMEKK